VHARRDVDGGHLGHDANGHAIRGDKVRILLRRHPILVPLEVRGGGPDAHDIRTHVGIQVRNRAPRRRHAAIVQDFSIPDIVLRLRGAAGATWARYK
jgi:hypothetical protein